MQILVKHLLIFFQISSVCLTLSISGFLLKKFILKKIDFKNFEENGLFGFIFIGFFSLLINFFYPLNININSFLFLLIFFTAYLFKFFDQKIIKLIKKVFFVSIISYILIIYSNVNTPDAYLYHLPYSKIVNENKIILGLVNLDHRYAHISIFQYISSFFVNFFLSKEGLLIPISLVPSFFFIYSFKKFNSYFKQDTERLTSYIIFIILIISIYSFSRYSGWGNDAQVHIFYFLGIVYFFKNLSNNENLYLFNKLCFVSIFTFLIKPFYFISFFIPLIFFLFAKDKLKLICSRTFVFLAIFCALWFFKNFLVSSCLIYPVNTTCFKSIDWYSNDTEKFSLQGEAWSKDWVNRKDKSLSYKKYIDGYDWIKTWSENHLNVIIEKVLPVLIFLLINIFLLFFLKILNKKPKQEKNHIIYSLFFLSIISIFLWFFKFPTYRFGLSFIYSFMILLFYISLLNKVDLKKIIKFKAFFTVIIFVSFIGLYVKNIVRINKTENISIYPVMFDKNNSKEVIKYYNKDGVFIHYKNPKGLCGYSPSPCTYIDSNIQKEYLFGYILFKSFTK